MGSSAFSLAGELPNFLRDDRRQNRGLPVFADLLFAKLLTAGPVPGQVPANSARSVYRTGSHSYFLQRSLDIFSWQPPLLINLISYMTAKDGKRYKVNVMKFMKRDCRTAG